MAHYLLGDTPVSSAPPLSILPKCLTGEIVPTVLVTQSSQGARPGAIRRWRHQWRDDTGRMVLGLAMTRSGYLLRFPRSCDFVISRDARHIDARPHRDVAPEMMEHLLADQVLPRCLAQRGELLVHSAGIAFGNDIALFAGESGRGKSTLAGLFFRAGRKVLTDDCLMLRPTPEAVRAFPTYPSLRLQPDSVGELFPGDTASTTLPSYPGKQRFSVPDASRDAATGRVAALYFLGDRVVERNDVRIEPLAPATSCIRLMEQTFLLDALDRDAVKRLLGLAGEVVARVPTFTLDYPRDFGRAAELVAGIERHFAGVAGNSSAA